MTKLKARWKWNPGGWYDVGVDYPSTEEEESLEKETERIKVAQQNVKKRFGDYEHSD